MIFHSIYKEEISLIGLFMRKWAQAEVDQLINEYAFPSDRSPAVYLALGQIQLIIHHGDQASNYRGNI